MPSLHTNPAPIRQSAPLLYIFMLWLHSVQSEAPTESVLPEMKSIQLDGDIILGGLFPMHEKGTDGALCGDIKVDKGIQRVEAMLYAIDAINNDTSILPTLKLGVHIKDTCLRDTFGLEQSLDFIKSHITSLDQADYTCSDGSAPTGNPAKPVVGVIGAAASPVSIMVANILRLFKIPQISYASTGIELSDKSRFEYFSRVVPPDSYQAQVMVDLVKKMNWTYVATLADEGNYGEKGIAEFAMLAENSKVCIAVSRKIPREVQTDTLIRLLQDLLEFPEARVVVMFANEDNCKKIIEAARQLRVVEHFTWLASDSWGAKPVVVEGREAAAEGAITILPQKKTLVDFDVYFQKLGMNNSRNPWFTEFWQKQFHCTTDVTNRSKKLCTGREVLWLSQHTQEGLVPFVVDAVYAMARALHNMHMDLCEKTDANCSRMFPIDGALLLDYIRKVEFEGITGNMVRFNPEGDASGRYTIYQYQKIHSSHSYNQAENYGYVAIGSWAERNLKLNHRLMHWRNSSLIPPSSVCSPPCGIGEKRSSEGCCWVCIKCGETEVVQDKLTCRECGHGRLPDQNRTHCVSLPILYMKLDTMWAVVPVAFSIVGISSVLFIFVVFCKFNETPIIMASGRELCYVLLMGFLLSYGMSFVMVAKPTPVSCGLQRLGLGTSLCLCYAALLTKTNRISRIFNRGIKAMVKRPSYTSPRSQIVICMTLVSVQVVAAVTWIILEVPGVTYDYPDRKTVILRCKTTNLHIVISLLYNMLLIIMCTVYAFKTRKIPENFNEAKYIAFTMYSTCIVWLAFIPTYFGTNKSDFRIQITALCMCVSISSTVAMGCLFIPKVYIVLFQPHKNVRAGKGGGGQGGRPLFGAKSGLAAMAAKNGGVTSPTGLALLIAQGSKTPRPSSSSPCTGLTQATTPTDHKDIKFMAVRDSDPCDMDFDMSEAEPEDQI